MKENIEYSQHIIRSCRKILRNGRRITKTSDMQMLNMSVSILYKQKQYMREDIERFYEIMLKEEDDDAKDVYADILLQFGKLHYDIDVLIDQQMKILLDE